MIASEEPYFDSCTCGTRWTVLGKEVKAISPTEVRCSCGRVWGCSPLFILRLAGIKFHENISHSVAVYRIKTQLMPSLA